MSIFTGKAGYSARPFWEERTRKAGMFDYDSGAGQHEGNDPCMRWLRSQLHDRPHVLEIGCGFGKYARALADLYASYTGVDPVQARVDYCRKTFPKCAFHNTEDTAPGGYLADVVMSATVIQHLTVPEAVNCLLMAEAFLKPGGRVLLAEWRIWDISLEDAERRYAEPSCPPHMIPKPISVLQAAVPRLKWEGVEGQFILRSA